MNELDRLNSAFRAGAICGFAIAAAVSIAVRMCFGI